MTFAEQLIARHVNAFNARDLDALLADFTDDTSWVTGDYSVPAGGLREFFDEAMRAILPHLEIRRVIDGGQVVAAELTETWEHQGSTRRAALIAVFDIERGRISRAKIYREGSADA
ncbi:nuclear transport factor 2 family protein [Glutamicibacter sp. PS]|uniref:nuclear transport factor 2 family protein n=1 Tax=Glutamicibacter sp. PS TaxID=3075634 RepID=UPI00283D3D07|nr:nuclear transport factor 2 family protein [Glutamicibacter sp. PS]MDR4534383.1 nuclear transport factor 2 family protein [Glutamicibacter sp. PS]